MKDSTPKSINLKDYTPPAYYIEQVDLHFTLGEECTRVKSVLQIRSRADEQPPLVLHGEGLELIRLAMDGEPLGRDQYKCSDDVLTIHKVTAAFGLEIETEIRPQENTSLEGLYKSSGNFCTQCEAEGFRKITYFLDRPDVMAVFTTTIVADRTAYPVLLSNGNLLERGTLDDNRHWVKWHDPFKKPSYLFALVAGDLRCVADRYVTRSGREVALEIYVEPDNVGKCDHAMASLQKAMRWDEEVFGLEYDLDTYMIVAVGDFNMGAMENKGLNIFNSKYVLASPSTATDADYEGIEGVIAHEYFHNWTGNRVTCRDWFQLSLKEGLTVFRDQEFSSDMLCRPVKRVQEVRMLRSTQFTEDAGPMAHPVRPDSYVEINNFYTSTVYNKGAEVIRMYHTLLGADGFRKGMDLYFQRHDGQAVTIDDFYAAMVDANDADLGNFKRWYSQAGTPEVKVRGIYDAEGQTYTLEMEQHCAPTPGQKLKRPFVIPVRTALLDTAGNELPLRLQDAPDGPAPGERVLCLTEAQQRFTFTGIGAEPVPSLLRDFSAPVKLRYSYSDEQLAFLLAHDTDAFNRWEAGQRLATAALMGLIDDHRQGADMAFPQVLADALGAVLRQTDLQQALVAEVLVLPAESYLAEQQDTVAVEATFAAREFCRAGVAQRLRDALWASYLSNQELGEYRYDAEAVGRRALKNVCLGYLMYLDDDDVYERCVQQYYQASNMTDALSALNCLANHPGDARAPALQHFYEQWQHDSLVMDKWLSIQARSKADDALATVQSLMDHPAFDIKNPNKVRALLATFCMGNAVRFHAADGAAYAFLADQVLRLDALNPQVAARMLSALSRWRRYDSGRQALMRAQLERVLAARKLSKDCYEIAAKSLA